MRADEGFIKVEQPSRAISEYLNSRVNMLSDNILVGTDCSVDNHTSDVQRGMGLAQKKWHQVSCRMGYGCLRRKQRRWRGELRGDKSPHFILHPQACVVWLQP